MSKFGSKGGWYMVEVMIVLAMLISVFFYLFLKPVNTPKYSNRVVIIVGEHALNSIPYIRYYICNNQTDTIKSKVRSLIPDYISFDVSLCDENCTDVNIPDETVNTIDYYVFCGDRAKKLKLFLWVSE